MDGDRERAKRLAAERAVEAVSAGAVVGLGTGSTAAHAIEALGRADRRVTGIPTSYQAEQRAMAAGVPIADPASVSRIDVAIDGADQVVGQTVIKGGGAAHVREKVVDASADRFIVVVDESKLADSLDHPVAVAVVPAARTAVSSRLRDLGGDPVLRSASEKAGPVVTDDGHLVIDCAFGAIEDPASLAERLSAVPGVVDHGLFVGLVDEIYVGSADGVEVTSV